MREAVGLSRRAVQQEEVIRSTRILKALEDGHSTTVTFPVINSLCRLYGVSDEMRKETERMFREMKLPEWHETSGSWINGTALLMQAERLASSISVYDTMQINGLLQTENYVRTRILRWPEWTPYVEATVEQRQHRQRQVWTQPNPPSARFVVGIPALETIRGTDQGHEILRYAAKENIAIRVQEDTDRFLRYGSAFTVLALERDGTRCAYTEPISAHRYESLPHAVDAYLGFFETAYSEAIPIEEYPDADYYLA